MRWPLILLSICLYSNSYAETDVLDFIKDINYFVSHATDPVTSCDDKRLPPKNVNYTKGEDASEFYKKVDLGLGSEFPSGDYEGDQISILTKEQADKLFKAFSEIEYMKFDYLHAGCEIRAHEFALIAKENGIEMGKGMTMYGDTVDRGGLYPEEWTEKKKRGESIPVPTGFVGWRYHVAPYVLVKEGNEVKPYVFDIGIAEKPKTLSQWNKSLTFSTAEETRTFVKDRNFLHPLDNTPRTEGKSFIGTELNKQELIREMGIFEFEYWNEKGLLSY